MQITVLGLVLSRPLTFISDVSLALICVTLAARLRESAEQQHIRFSYWFFILLGASTFLGGAAHLFDRYLGAGAHHMAWLINGISVVVAEIGATSLVRRRGIQHLLLLQVVLRYGALVFLVITTGRFLWVGLHAAVGFILVVSTIHIAHSLRSGDRSYLVVPLASAAMLIPAATHALNIGLNTSIDRNVVSHVLLIPALYLLGTAFAGEYRVARESETANPPRRA
jgi:FlaA1/EpsC-like NDP-sugar epimerase